MIAALMALQLLQEGKMKAKKNRPKFHSTTPEQSNDMGNGWTNGNKDFKQLWQETEDIECEIIKPKQIGNEKDK